MHPLDTIELAEYLKGCGFIDDIAGVEIRPLNGGVSSAIHAVQTPTRTFVVKQSLEKLKVEQDWHCDTSRNLYEQDYLAWAGGILPASVPALLHCDRERGLFLMEYLGETWSTWKALLWEGRLSSEIAHEAGRVLGTLHRYAWNDAEVAGRFDNTPLFHDLRVAPYLLAAAEKHSDLVDLLKLEAARIERTRLTLVHGDYSPKNLMTDGKGLKILDAEVAWFGEPAFDIAFLSTHLWLKAVRFPGRAEGYLRLQSLFLRAYGEALGSHWSGDLEQRAARLLPMLIVARVSGKSPAGYFAKGGSEEIFLLKYAKGQLLSGEGPQCFVELSRNLIDSLTA